MVGWCGPMVRPRDSSALLTGAPLWSARITLPASLRLQPLDSAPHGVGVFATTPLPRGLRMGPYGGRLTRAMVAASWYGWRLRDERLVDADDEEHSNWMRFVNCTPHAARRNLAGFQHRGALYYRTVAPVAVGDQLLIYYGDDYTSNVDGYDVYIPPKDEPGQLLTATGNDCARSVGVGPYNDSLKEKPEPELADSDGDLVKLESYLDCDSPKVKPELQQAVMNDVDADGYQDYLPPKEEPETVLTATDSGGGDGSGDDYTCNIAIDSYNDSPKEEPELELSNSDGDVVNLGSYYDCDSVKVEPEPQNAAMSDVVDDGGATDNYDGYYDPPKEKPETEFGGSDRDAVNIESYDCNLPKEEVEFPVVECGVGDCGVADDYDPPKEEPEPKLGSCGEDTVNIDSHYDCDSSKEEAEFGAMDCGIGDCGVADDCNPPKEEPVQKLGGSDEDTINIDSHYDCDSPKEDPEPEIPTTGDDAVTESNRKVGHDCSYCGADLCNQKFKVKHELGCKVRMEPKGLESQVTNKLYHCGYCRCPFVNNECKEQHQQKYCRKRPVVMRKNNNSTYYECTKCKFITKRKFNLERHVLNHIKNNGEWLTCTQCSYKTVHKRDMSKHMKNHGNNFNWCCPICGNSFRGKQCLGDHLLKQHPDESEEVSKLITSKIYTCNT